MTPWYLAAGLAVVALVWWLLRSGNRGGDDGFSLANFQPRPMRPLTRDELSVLERLQSALPECLVLPQVSLSRFLQVAQNRSYQAWFQKVGRRCVDFLLCSARGDVLGVVELGRAVDPRTALSQGASDGAARKAESLRMAGIPIWTLNPNDLPSLDDLRELVLQQWTPSVQGPQGGSLWQLTEMAPRAGGLEVAELGDSSWQHHPWPTEDARASAFLDALDGLPQAPARLH